MMMVTGETVCRVFNFFRFLCHMFCVIIFVYLLYLFIGSFNLFYSTYKQYV